MINSWTCNVRLIVWFTRSNVVEVNVITDYISKCWLHESNRFD